MHCSTAELRRPTRGDGGDRTRDRWSSPGIHRRAGTLSVARGPVRRNDRPFGRDRCAAVTPVRGVPRTRESNPHSRFHVVPSSIPRATKRGGRSRTGRQPNPAVSQRRPTIGGTYFSYSVQLSYARRKANGGTRTRNPLTDVVPPAFAAGRSSNRGDTPRLCFKGETYGPTNRSFDETLQFQCSPIRHSARPPHPTHDRRLRDGHG